MVTRSRALGHGHPGGGFSYSCATLPVEPPAATHWQSPVFHRTGAPKCGPGQPCSLLCSQCLERGLGNPKSSIHLRSLRPRMRNGHFYPSWANSHTSTLASTGSFLAFVSPSSICAATVTHRPIFQTRTPSASGPRPLTTTQQAGRHQDLQEAKILK